MGKPKNPVKRATLHEKIKLDDRKSRVEELRFFGDLNAEETAQVLGISSRTVHRDAPSIGRDWPVKPVIHAQIAAR